MGVRLYPITEDSARLEALCFMEGRGVRAPSWYNAVGHETALDLARQLFSLAEGVKWL